MGQLFPDHCTPTESTMMLKVVIVALAPLVLLEQASGEGDTHININDTSQDMLLGRIKGLEVQLTKTQGQLMETQEQLKDIAGKHATGQEQLKDLTAQVKNLTLDLCRTKKSCCNKTLPCPCGYEQFSERPDMCYKFSTDGDGKNYNNARSDCKADGGHLAMPKDKATSDFLEKLIKARYVNSSAGNSIGVWIGLSDEVTDGPWVWEDGTPLGWSNWYPGRSDLNIAVHDCASWLHQTHKWYNVPCNFVFPYICEVKATAVP